MIRLFDGWIVLVDELCYTLARETGRFQTDKKSGKTRPVRKIYGYYGDLEQALIGLGRQLNHEKFFNNELTLDEAIAVIQETNNQIRELIEQYTGEAKPKDGR